MHAHFLASRLNGSDFNGDRQGDYALCMLLNSECFTAGTVMHLQQILASMTQHKGRKQGFLWDPLTMTPLVRMPCCIHAVMHHAVLCHAMPHFLLLCHTVNSFMEMHAYTGHDPISHVS